jgi:hypothetical protein
MSSIETERLLLRLPQITDPPAFLEVHQDQEVIALKQVTLTEPPGGVEPAVRNVDRMLSHLGRLVVRSDFCETCKTKGRHAYAARKVLL